MYPAAPVIRPGRLPAGLTVGYRPTNAVEDDVTGKLVGVWAGLAALLVVGVLAMASWLEIDVALWRAVVLCAVASAVLLWLLGRTRN